MPEFILDNDGDVKGTEFADLDSFTQGYIEAMFFTEEAPGITIEEFKTPEYQEEMKEGRTDGCIPGECGFGDIHPDSLADIIAACSEFKNRGAILLEHAYARDYEPIQAGRDFWFSRNGHGTGFQDREALESDPDNDLPDLGRALKDLAKEFGEAHVWFADHVTYGDAPFVYHQ